MDFYWIWRFFFIWLITGIFYVLPPSVLKGIDRWMMEGKKVQVGERESKPANVEFVPVQLDYRDITVSIPEAISILETEMGHTIQVTQFSLYALLDTLVYEIILEDGGRHLIDAIKGIPVIITEAEIKTNAIAAAPPGSNIVNMTFLNKRPYAYWGIIPTYRFIFDDASKTYVYVSPITSRVEGKSTRLNRLQHWMDSLHKFEFLMLIWERQALRKGGALIISLVGLAVVLTGLYIALPIKMLRRLSGKQSEIRTKLKTRR